MLITVILPDAKAQRKENMIMRKRIFAYVMALCLTAALAAGCGGKDDTPAQTNAPGTAANSGSGTETTAAQTAAGGFSFELKGTVITPGMKQEALLAALGDADKNFEAPSCAGEGTDYTFTYGSVEISTVPDADGVNEVTTIVLKDDLVSTPEGVSLFMKVADMTGAYGEDYTVNGSAYTYTKGNVQLQFIAENDEITSIQYMLMD